MSRPRKNKKFIDPRYFMDEKMEVIKEVEIEPRKSRDLKTGWGMTGAAALGATIGSILPIVGTAGGAVVGFGAGKLISDVINSRINQGILDRLAKAKVSEETVMATAQTLFDEAKAGLEEEGAPVPDDAIAMGVGEWLDKSLDSARLSPEQMEEIRFDEKTLRDLSDNLQLEDVVIDVLSKKNMLVGDTLGTAVSRRIKQVSQAADPAGALARAGGRALAQEKLKK